VQDRSGSSKVPLTQCTLAQMLGVRRTTVTMVAGRLEAAGVIKYHRGRIEIISRQELERCSCECYGRVKAYVAGLSATPGESVVPLGAARPLPQEGGVIFPRLSSGIDLDCSDRLYAPLRPACAVRVLLSVIEAGRFAERQRRECRRAACRRVH
jgi:hypothetical protein